MVLATWVRAGLWFLAASGACLAQRFAPPPQASSYRLIFADDFDDLALGVHTWYEGVWFHHQHAPKANISVADSVLSLRWSAAQSSPDTSISSFSRGRSTTQAWQYGYFEARMKWDVVKGGWPALWLIPLEDALGESTHNGIRESGEIDIFEGQGDHPHTYFGTLHDWVNLHDSATPENHFDLPDNLDLSQFHLYGLLWTPGTVSWYLDNQLLHTEKTPAVFDRQHFFLVIGMQEGVNWRLGDKSGITSPQMKLAVDWVHVWQR